jgi:hypothetical protein
VHGVRGEESVDASVMRFLDGLVVVMVTHGSVGLLLLLRLHRLERFLLGRKAILARFPLNLASKFAQIAVSHLPALGLRSLAARLLGIQPFQLQLLLLVDLHSHCFFEVLNVGLLPCYLLLQRTLLLLQSHSLLDLLLLEDVMQSRDDRWRVVLPLLLGLSMKRCSLFFLAKVLPFEILELIYREGLESLVSLLENFASFLGHRLHNGLLVIFRHPLMPPLLHRNRLVSLYGFKSLLLLLFLYLFLLLQFLLNYLLLFEPLLLLDLLTPLLHLFSNFLLTTLFVLLF